MRAALSPQAGRGAPSRASADSTHAGLVLAVADQHPKADRGNAEDHGNRNCPYADPDVADGLALGFVLGDFTIPLFCVVAHRPPFPIPRVALSDQPPQD